MRKTAVGILVLVAALAAAAVPASGDASTPASIVGKAWTVMAPFDKPGATRSPENLYVTRATTEPRFAPYFHVDPDGGLAFVTPAGGTHSENSEYPRTELRQMADLDWKEAAWSSRSGTHTLTGVWSVADDFVARPQVVVAQIHDDDDDVMQVALDGSRLVAFFDDKATVKVLDPDYEQGSKFSLKIRVGANHITVFLDGTQKADVVKSGTDWYFKAGSYIQTNVADWGELPTASATVKIYSLSVGGGS